MLLYKLEKLREIMHQSITEKGIGHPDTIKLSRELDKLINQFMKTT